jgi:hypothetical protein
LNRQLTRKEKEKRTIKASDIIPRKKTRRDEMKRRMLINLPFCSGGACAFVGGRVTAGKDR